MHAMISFVLIAIMAVCALAAPAARPPMEDSLTVSQTNQKRSFTIPVKARHGRHHLNPALDMARAFGKFGWGIIINNPFDPFGGESSTSIVLPVPTATSSVAPVSYPSSTAAAAASAAASATGSASSGDGMSGVVQAAPAQDESEYLEKVSIGGQNLELDFDTGSADLWVFSSDLTTSESAGHSVFNPSKSSSWSAYEGGSWKIEYGDGSGAAGSVGFDKVTVGGVTATKQAVEIATTVSTSFSSDTANDGLLGLGFSSINTIRPEPQKTFFENIMGQLEQPLFTANLKDNAAGEYTFGKIDKTKYTGEIHYTPIDTVNGFWQFESPSYTIGGTKSACKTCSQAIADTGTSLVLLDEDVVEAYYAQVDGAKNDVLQGGYVYPCTASPPDLGVAIGSGYTATIKGADIQYANLGNGECFGGVQSNQGQGLQILGDVLLKQVFAVFDGGNQQFGIATKASSAVL